MVPGCRHRKVRVANSRDLPAAVQYTKLVAPPPALPSPRVEYLPSPRVEYAPLPACGRKRASSLTGHLVIMRIAYLLQDIYPSQNEVSVSALKQILRTCVHLVTREREFMPKSVIPK